MSFSHNNSATDEQPAHHVHRDDDPLPGAKGAPVAPDYSKSAVEAPGFEEHANVNLDDHPHGITGKAAKAVHEINPANHRKTTDDSTSSVSEADPVNHEGSGTQIASNGKQTAHQFVHDTSTPDHHQKTPAANMTGSGVVHTDASRSAHTDSGPEHKHDPAKTEHDDLKVQPAAHADSGAKPKLADKLVGKAQQVAGKITKNADLQTKGEVRSTEGKTA